jgi:cellulose synthase/poly-beta-1,6-N-acetylglucosamine synthase-like glycosyltransferase
MENIIYYLNSFILGYFALVWVGYTFFLLATFSSVINKYRTSTSNNIIGTFNQRPLLPISIIIPAYNEGKRILNTITSILNSDYKNVHIIVVNDGSKDDTLDILIETYSLIKIPPAFKQKIITGQVYEYYQSKTVPNFIVVDKEHSPFANSGADCINAGLNVCRTPIFLTVDSDTLLEPMTLSRMLFVHLTNPHCVAVGGDIYVPDATKIKDGKLLDTNISSNPIVGVQVCEYLRSFLYGREGWSLLGGALCFPGALTMLETEAVRDAGGYDSYNFAYDAEIILKLHHEMRKNKYPYTIIYEPSAIAWSEVPDTLKKLWKQRTYWQRGLLRCLSLHKVMLLNPKYGITGCLALPYYIIFEIFGPVVESLAYIILILTLCFSAISLTNLGWYILLAWGYITFITMSCVVLSLLTYNRYNKKMDILRIFALTTFDMFFCRQWRAFSALFSSIHYVFNRIRGKAL